MADVRAFRGFRYDLGRVGALSEVVAPPYDVIDPALQQHCTNAVPTTPFGSSSTRKTPADTDNDNRYTPCRRLLRDWQARRHSRQDSARCLYVYHQEFEVEGKTLHPPRLHGPRAAGDVRRGRIYPHEETMSGPKADRLKLFHATGMNLSPIFGLYPDERRRGAFDRSTPPSAARCRSRRPIISASSAGCGRSPISMSSAP